MSKIGQKNITIPSGVQVTINGLNVMVKGSKGELHVILPNNKLIVTADQGAIKVKRTSEANDVKAIHGLFRSLIANAVAGVEKDWEKRLEVVGTGFNVKAQGQDIIFKIGYSHPVIFKSVPGISLKVEGNNKVVISGVDKQLVGQVAYQIKKIRKPDAYKGKGIRYEGEVIKTKAGKKAKA